MGMYSKEVELQPVTHQATCHFNHVRPLASLPHYPNPATNPAHCGSIPLFIFVSFNDDTGQKPREREHVINIWKSYHVATGLY
jgi:hypothetical protein